VKVLIISDIHGNAEGFDACMAAAPSFDKVFNLGDIVGYGASPNEVVNKSRDLGGLFVRGNHDKACSGVDSTDGFNMMAALAAYWTQKNLNPENLAWVKALPKGPVMAKGIENVHCVHGSPLDEDEYIIIVRDAYEPLRRATVPVTFFGHTHMQGGFAVENDQWATLRPGYQTKDKAENVELQLETNSKYLINPGSVGQPRDGDWRAAFAVFDTEKMIVTFFRIPYDVKAAQKKIMDAGLPDRLATRLTDGR